MKKKIFCLLLSLLVGSFCLVTLNGCKKENLAKEQALAQLIGFSVAKSITVDLNSEFIIPQIVVFGEDNVEYTANITVTVNGKNLTFNDNKFVVNEFFNYIITYSIEYKGFVFTKTTIIIPSIDDVDSSQDNIIDWWQYNNLIY